MSTWTILLHSLASFIVMVIFCTPLMLCFSFLRFNYNISSADVIAMNSVWITVTSIVCAVFAIFFPFLYFFITQKCKTLNSYQWGTQRYPNNMIFIYLILLFFVSLPLFCLGLANSGIFPVHQYLIVWVSVLLREEKIDFTVFWSCCCCCSFWAIKDRKTHHVTNSSRKSREETI